MHGRQGAQPARTSTSTFPLGSLVAVTGVSGLGQVDAGQRHPLHRRSPSELNGARTVPGPAQAGHRARPPRQGRPRRPEPDRPHAAVQPGDLHRRLRPRAQAVRRDDRGQGPRLPAGPVLLQRQGRPLRGLRRRRHDQDRDELPARRLRAVRGLPRRPLQPRDARGALQGQDHRRRARHADRGGGSSSSRRSRRSPGTCGRSSTSASATSGSASRRRPCPAARRSGSSWPPSCRSARPAARSTCSTSRPPACTSRTSASCSACCRARRQGQHGHRHRAQPRRHQERRLGHRHGPRGRQRRRPGVAEGTPEDDRRGRPASHTGRFLAPLLERAARRRQSRRRSGRLEGGVSPRAGGRRARPRRRTAAKTTAAAREGHDRGDGPRRRTVLPGPRRARPLGRRSHR